MKTWYAAKLLFASTINGEKRQPALCEESIRVLLAETEDDALARAQELGKAGEHDYPNEDGETVNWHFVSVIEVQDLTERELHDGAEVFSRLFFDASETN